MRDQPGDLIIERLGVPGGVTGPRHRGHRHPVGRTAHPRRLSLDEHLHRAGIQRPPPAPSLTLVVTTATPTTTPTPTTGTSSQPTRHDDHLEVFVELDALHHHLMVNTDHPACQWPAGSARGRPVVLPTGGHRFCSLAARG